MALEKQPFPVVLTQGVDTKTDPKAVVPGKLLTLENGVMVSPGRIKKRNGFANLGRGVVGSSSTISTGKGLFSFLDELCLADGGDLYSYDPATDAWVDKGAFVSLGVTQRPVIRNTYEQSAQDSTTHTTGLQCFAWEDSRGGVRYSVVDSATGLNVVDNQQIDASGSRPKVLSHGNSMLVFYVVGTSLYYRPIGVATPKTLGSAVLLTNDLAAGQLNYDATIVGQRCFIAWNKNGGNVEVQYLLTSLQGSSVVAFTGPATTCLAIFQDSLGQRVGIAWYTGTKVRFTVYDYDLANVIKAPTDVETVANVVNVSGVAIAGATSNLGLLYTVSAAAATNYLVRGCNIAAYTAGTPGVFLRSVSLAGKSFVYEGTAYSLVVHGATLQGTYFVVDHGGTLIGKLFYGLAGGVPARSILPECNAVGSSRFQLSGRVKDRLVSVGSNFYTLTGVSTVTVDFADPVVSHLRAELGANLHVSGGFLWMYDGGAPVEHGFHLFPEGVSVPNPGGIHTYQYKVCYEWTDRQGQIHRSAPSTAVTQAQGTEITSGASSVNVTVPALRLTAKAGVTIVVYRTLDNGTIFYQTTSLSSPTYNSTTSDTVTVNDVTTDAVLIGNPRLYTTGGVFENVAPNAISAIVEHQNRILLVDAMDRLAIWFSKEVIPGAPVEFSDWFRLNLSPTGGDATAVASLDGKIIAFRADRLSYVFGQGPDATGTNNDFSPDQTITTDCGCTNPRSVVLMPDGLMFQSKKGIYLLDRSLQVSYVGADVEAYNEETITSATLMRTTNQVRFTLASGVSLVFDYRARQWSVFTNVNAVDAAIFGDRFVYAKPDGYVRQETPGVFSDAGSFIRRRIVTSWLQPAGIQGYQRIYRMLLLGDYVSPHKLIVKTAYDFNPAPYQQDVIDPGTILGASDYGDDSVYGGGGTGDDAVYGGAFPLYQWRIPMARQKCEAVQFTIEDAQSGTDVGEGSSVSSIVLLLGVKPGVRRMPNSSSTRTLAG